MSIYLMLFIMGAIFTIMGMVMTIVFVSFGQFGAMALIPLLFVMIGIAFVTGAGLSIQRKKRIVTLGTKYAAKIYSYVPNTSYMVNGEFTVNVKVHYFDRDGIEKEAVIPTEFAKGSGEYPIGMTMDIYEYEGKYSFDKNSVRDEVLPGEAELMDDKPVDRAKIKITAAQCPNCGSSFQATAGYSNKCPFCGSFVNA